MQASPAPQARASWTIASRSGVKNLCSESVEQQRSKLLRKPYEKSAQTHTDETTTAHAHNTDIPAPNVASPPTRAQGISTSCNTVSPGLSKEETQRHAGV